MNLSIRLLHTVIFALFWNSIALAQSPKDEESIAGVAAGRLETAQAAWWGFDPSDATTALQAALDSRAKRVIIGSMGQPWIVTTIRLPSEKEIVFEEGVVVEAKRGAFLRKNDCLFMAHGCRGLTLRGNGAVLRMHKSDYHKPPYELAEWRHALTLRGCEDVTIEGLTLAESGGDGIYLGSGDKQAPNRNIVIRDVICDGNNRQGISIITAENLLIENCVFSNTRGTAPQAGIDFEPNHPQERLVNCVLRNCRSENNAGHAYHLYLGQMHDESPPVSIRFENCSSKDCERNSTYVGVVNRDGKRTVRGVIEYVNCRFVSDRAAGITVNGNEADGCKVRFERCEIVRRDEAETRFAPITIIAPRRLDVAAGNIEISECVVHDTLDRQPIALHGTPMTGIRNLSGSLTVHSPKGRLTYTLDSAQLQKWFPAHGQIGEIPKYQFNWQKALPMAPELSTPGESSAPFRLRRKASLIVWGKAGVELEIFAKMEPVGRYTPEAGAIQLTAHDGTVTSLKPDSDGRQVRYSFTPTIDGPHRLDWQGDIRETLCVVRCSAPFAILNDEFGVHFIRPIGSLQFVVPPGTQRFAVLVEGAGTGERVKAIVRDEAGDVVVEKDNIGAPHLFVLKPKDRKVGVVWSITFGRASEGVLEDVTLHVIGIPPLLHRG